MEQVDGGCGDGVPAVAGVSAPAVGWASGPLGVVQACDREMGRLFAARARAVAAFAESRPVSVDRPAGAPGAMGADRRAGRAEVLAEVSEWAVQELVVASSLSARAAEVLVEQSLTLVHRLPGTLAGLESGLLHPGHLWPMVEHVAPILDPQVRAGVEAELLGWVAARQVTAPPQLGAKARRVVLARDARAVAARLAAAVALRGVWVRPDRSAGMAVVSAVLTTPEAAALVDALGRYVDAIDAAEREADASDPGKPDIRTRGQKMVDCLLDLVLRPGEHQLAPVQAQLTVVASVSTMAGGDQPGEVDGQPVPAEMVRALAHSLGLLPEEDAPDHLDDPETGAMRQPLLEASLQRCWAANQARALAQPWFTGSDHQADDPPLEVQLALWEQQAWQGQLLDLTDVFDPWETPDPHDPDLDRAAPERPDPERPDPERPDPEHPTPQRPDPEGSPGPRPATGAGDGDGDRDRDGAGRSFGSWAAADRAVDTAIVRLLELDQAIRHARATVWHAQRAEDAEQATWRASPAAAITTAPDTLTALAAAGPAQRAALGALLEATAGGGLLDRPRIAVCDALTGALLSLTDAAGLRRAVRNGTGLGPPPASPGYRPRTALDRYVRARDRRCRFPGCRRPVPRHGELDHNQPWPEGPTAAANLTGYCTGHHRGKHQAPGWSYDLSPDGTLTVTTPTGLTATTTPPPF